MENNIGENYVYKNNETPLLRIQGADKLICNNYSTILKNAIDGLADANVKRIIISDSSIDSIGMLIPCLFSNDISSIIARLYLEQSLAATETILNSYKNLKIVICIEIESVDTFTWDKLESASFLLGDHLQGFLLAVNENNLATFPTILNRMRNISPVSIIVSPDFGFDDDKVNWLELNQLYSQMIAFNQQAGAIDASIMDYGYLPSRLLNEHPCNGYMCSGHTCHSFKGNLPRRLILRYDGVLLPESMLVPENYAIGNLYESSMRNVLNQYRDGKQHSLFLKAARELYIQWVQTCPYKVVPWGALMVEQTNKNKG